MFANELHEPVALGLRCVGDLAARCLRPKTSVPGRTSRLRQGGEQEE
jgi:hypothetical protein